MQRNQFEKIIANFSVSHRNTALDVFNCEEIEDVKESEFKKFIGKLIGLEEETQTCRAPYAKTVAGKKGRVGTAVTHSVRLAEAELQLRIDHLTELKKQQQDFLEMLFINSTDQKNSWVGISEMQNEVSSLYREFPDTERPANNKPTANEQEY